MKVVGRGVTYSTWRKRRNLSSRTLERHEVMREIEMMVKTCVLDERPEGDHRQYVKMAFRYC
jgi:hypothetical protein